MIIDFKPCAFQRAVAAAAGVMSFKYACLALNEIHKGGKLFPLGKPLSLGVAHVARRSLRMPHDEIVVEFRRAASNERLDDDRAELNIAAECVSKLDAGSVNQRATNSSRRLASISCRLERRCLSDIEHVTT